jgi:hypothetical protein
MTHVSACVSRSMRPWVGPVDVLDMDLAFSSPDSRFPDLKARMYCPELPRSSADSQFLPFLLTCVN